MISVSARRSALSFFNDRANLITLVGLCCGFFSIYSSARGATTVAVIALLWALFCDWFDGPVARRTLGRTDIDRAFGGQLDSLVDLVSSGAGPAMLLLSVGQFNPWFLPGACALMIAGAMRLAHFNVIGMNSGEYSGLPIDTNIIAVTALFAMREPLGESLFPGVLYAVVVLLALLNIGRFRSPKLVGFWYYLIATYVLGMTLFFYRSL